MADACEALSNRGTARAVLNRVLPLASGLVPGVIIGALLLGHIAPASVKLAAFLTLLPLILLQAAGKRFPLRREKTAAAPLGVGDKQGLALCALAVYALAGLYTSHSTNLLTWIAPGVLIGVAVGHALVKRISAATFRRVCTSFDAYLVASGLSHALAASGVARGVAYQLLVATAIIDLRLLWTYFRPEPVVEAHLELAA